jgi:hypothetical protein
MRSGGERYQQWRRVLSGRQRDGGGAGAAGMLRDVQKKKKKKSPINSRQRSRVER